MIYSKLIGYEPEYSVRIKTHILPIRIIANIVVPLACENCVDGRFESMTGYGGAACHRLEKRSEAAHLTKDDKEAQGKRF